MSRQIDIDGNKVLVKQCRNCPVNHEYMSYMTGDSSYECYHPLTRNREIPDDLGTIPQFPDFCPLAEANE